MCTLCASKLIGIGMDISKKYTPLFVTAFMHVRLDGNSEVLKPNDGECSDVCIRGMSMISLVGLIVLQEKEGCF